MSDYEFRWDVGGITKDGVKMRSAEIVSDLQRLSDLCAEQADRIVELEAEFKARIAKLKTAAQKRVDCGHDDECGGKQRDRCGCGHTDLENALEGGE